MNEEERKELWEQIKQRDPQLAQFLIEFKKRFNFTVNKVTWLDHS